MALDRQRILSELGNVMSQLQSADCGCMGKLFSNPASRGGSSTLGNPLPTCSGCRHGCCHGHGYNHSSPHAGYGAHCAGEPHPSMNYQARCNPQKSYSDTYNYLNQNLMQPVMEDVYNDLNSLSQANTVSNNPLANQMGIAAAPGQSPMMSSPEGQVGNMNTNAFENHDPVISSMQYGNQMNMQSTKQAVNMHNQVPQNINGIGPHIWSADMGNASKPGAAGQGGQLTVPMMADTHQTPHGQVGITPLNAMSHNQNQYVMNMSQETNKVPNTNTQNNILGFNKHGLMQNNALNYTQQTNKLQSNPAAQPVVAAHNHYGDHNSGIKKFNEMFPGVMQGSGGDLGYDPMAIAVQMNPANRQKAFLNRNVEVDKLLKPGINETNAEAANIAQPKSAGVPQQNIPLSDNKNSVPEQEQIEQNHSQGQNIGKSFAQQQQILTAQMGDINNNKQKLPQPPNHQSPNFDQYQLQQSQPNDQMHQQQQQNNIDPDLSGRTSYQNQNRDSISQQQLKEHLLPVDTSRYLRPISMKQQRSNEYNTLGQPVEILPAEVYYQPEPTLPQTLSPQDAVKRIQTNNYNNVKSTISKTSLMGNRRASRSQLQHVYKQYKGSQSVTQQNIKDHDQASPKTTSEGKLGIPNTPQQIPQVPVERVGGDTISTNKQGNTQIPSNQEEVGKLGDHVAMNKPHGDIIPDKKAPRNGIQDITFPTYTSCSWSFQRPVPTNYGYGNRYRRY